MPPKKANRGLYFRAKIGDDPDMNPTGDTTMTAPPMDKNRIKWESGAPTKPGGFRGAYRGFPVYASFDCANGHTVRGPGFERRTRPFRSQSAAREPMAQLLRELRDHIDGAVTIAGIDNLDD